MKVYHDPVGKRCEIWLRGDERESYRTDPDFRRICQICRERQERVCVYVGGSRELLPQVTMLLDSQHSGMAGL